MSVFRFAWLVLIGLVLLGRGAAGADPGQFGEEGHRAAEAQRRAAIAGQLRLQEDLRPRRSYGGVPYAYPGAVPYGYGYAAPWAVPRVYRNGPWAYRFGVPYGYPPALEVPQPTGHEETWTGTNGYIYQPRYDAPPSRLQTIPAAPAAPAPLAPPAGPQEF